MVVAYEPVWAIGTGQSATPDAAQAMMARIRETLASIYGAYPATLVPLLVRRQRERRQHRRIHSPSRYRRRACGKRKPRCGRIRGHRGGGGGGRLGAAWRRNCWSSWALPPWARARVGMELARAFDGEIVSADSRQVYRMMDNRNRQAVARRSSGRSASSHRHHQSG